jgi:hypothetical protein
MSCPPPRVGVGLVPTVNARQARGRQKPDAGFQPAGEAGEKSVADGILGTVKRHRAISVAL